jgi:hypothetical protein
MSYSAIKPGGVAVFQEYDFSVLHPTYPSAPLWESVLRVFREFFHRVLRRTTGTQLYQLAVAAGFRSVECRVEYPLDGGANSPYYEWIAESLRSILPRAEALGVLRAADVEIDTLAERLRKEAVANGSCPRNGRVYRTQTVASPQRCLSSSVALHRTSWLNCSSGPAARGAPAATSGSGG